MHSGQSSFCNANFCARGHSARRYGSASLEPLELNPANAEYAHTGMLPNLARKSAWYRPSSLYPVQ